MVELTCCCIFSQASGRETVYLHTDRRTYIAGETVLYKLYVLNATTNKRSEISHIGYIVLRAGNLNPVIKIGVKVEAGIADGFFVLPDTLTSGVYQLVAFTNVMKNQGKQFFFHKEIVVANRYDKDLNLKLSKPALINTDTTCESNLESGITTDKPEYGIRQKVKVTLGRINQLANVSVSVFEESVMRTEDKSMAETLKRSTVKPDNYSGQPDYLFERNGKVLSGRVIDEVTQKYIPSATVLLSCIDSVPDLQYAYTNSNGTFQILLSEYYSGKELFLTIKDVPPGKHWKIVGDDQFALNDDNWETAHLQMNDKAREFIAKCQHIVYINKVYKLNPVVNEKNIESNIPVCPQVYYCPVKTVTLSDFVSLNDFSEIIVELFPLIKVNKDNGNSTLKVMNTTTYQYSEQGPAVFLDGVYVDDINKIIGLGSDKIRKIDVIYAERTFGDLVFQGIISINTKSTEIAKTKPASYSLRLKNNLIQSGKSIIQDDQSSILLNGNKPFFKQLLYWNPEIEIKSMEPVNFEFYTSDNEADFNIKVEGISNDGTPISMNKCIRVINK